VQSIIKFYTTIFKNIISACINTQKHPISYGFATYPTGQKVAAHKATLLADTANNGCQLPRQHCRLTLPTVAVSCQGNIVG